MPAAPAHTCQVAPGLTSCSILPTVNQYLIEPANVFSIQRGTTDGKEGSRQVLASARRSWWRSDAAITTKRVRMTLDEMRYTKRLNTSLEEAPTKTSLQGDEIYIRPPLGLKGPTQAFGLTGTDPGKFDIENSFIDATKGTSLHVVARVKKAKAPAGAKKAAAAPVETVPRGKFIDDVVKLVKAAYNVELTPGEFKPESKSHLGRDNAYKARKMDMATKQVEVFVYTESNGVREVALIFEFPKIETNYMRPKVDLCLESFAVGDRARRSFDGTISELDAGAGEVAGSGSPPPIEAASRRPNDCLVRASFTQCRYDITVQTALVLASSHNDVRVMMHEHRWPLPGAHRAETWQRIIITGSDNPLSVRV